MHYFSNLFDKALYMFQTGPMPIIRSISTVYTHKMVFVMLVLLVSASMVRLGPDHASMKNTYCVYTVSRYS
jgi:hypothetical protein